MLKKIFFSMILLLICKQIGFTQDYKSAIGLRLGVPASISYKLNITEKYGGELILGTQGRNTRFSYGWRRFVVGGTFLINNDIGAIEGLNWYYGGGLSASFWRYTDSFYYENSTNVSVGIHGSVGLEYNFSNIPLNLTLDWQPGVFINGFFSGFGGGYGALAVRYILN